MTFGRLEPVEIRKGWPREDSDFTPWLAKPENLALLGAEISIEIELVEIESSVGQFRADILAKRSGTDETVVIENQYGNTDHSHLGQLLTYAAGVGSTGAGAKTVIWIAEKFTEPHRATLDWLNQSTEPGIRFFGIELQLWRIGESAFAPKFNVVSRPNDYQKELTRQAAALSETEKLYVAFWSAFITYCGDETPLVMASPLPRHYLPTTIGRAGFGVNLVASKRNRTMECQLWIEGESGKRAFAILLERQPEIMAALGANTVFDPMPGKRACVIYETATCDVSDQGQWPEHFAWLKSHGERYAALFRPMIAQLQLG